MTRRWLSLPLLLLLWAFVAALFGGMILRTSLPSTPVNMTPPESSPTRTPAVVLSPEAQAPRTPKAVPTLEVTATPTPPALSPEVNAALDALERQVADVRQLAILQAVPRQALPPSAWEQRLAQAFLQAYPSASVEAQARMFQALGWVEPAVSLWGRYADLYEAVVGERFAFFDPEAGVLAVRLGGPFDGAARADYVRTFVHVLQAQNFAWSDFGVAGFPALGCLSQSDACRARAALTVGDALWSEALWVARFASPEDKETIQYAASAGEMPADTPWFLQRLAAFPYEAGFNFVAVLYSRGGWAEVNEAYAAPPVSSEQILHPERYPQVVPLEVTLPDLAPALGPGWEEVARGTLGEWGVLAWLAYGADPATRLDEARARRAADGWRGDAYAVYRRSADGALAAVLTIHWANGPERYAFTKALAHILAARTGSQAVVREGVTWWAGSGEVHGLLAKARTTVWAMAPDEALLQAILAAVATEHSEVDNRP